MFSLRLMGIKLADEASDTAVGGLKNFLGALGFISPLLGGEEVLRWFLTGSGSPRAGVALIVLGLPLYLSPAAWKAARRRIKRGKASDQAPEYLSQKDSELGYAIISMARKSAVGRWKAAQQLVSSGTRASEHYLYRWAASVVMEEITNGKLQIRGRRPNPEQLGYEPIDRTHWRSTWLMPIEDQISLWKIKLIPKGVFELDRGGAIVRADDTAAAQRTSLLNYDSLIVDASQFENLWPQTDALADKERRKFLREARHRRLDKDEILRLS